MGGAAFFGIWLVSYSKLVLVLAIVSHLSHWWFLSNVERSAHIRRGLFKLIRNVDHI
jgi:phosphatidylethanolamine N-methyltransferase